VRKGNADREKSIRCRIKRLGGKVEQVQNLDKNLIDRSILLLSERMIFFNTKHDHFFARPGHGQRGRS
jgi:hypothetical protein